MFESWKHVEPFTNEEVNAGSWCMCIYVCVCVRSWMSNPIFVSSLPKTKIYIYHISHSLRLLQARCEWDLMKAGISCRSLSLDRRNRVIGGTYHRGFQLEFGCSKRGSIRDLSMCMMIYVWVCGHGSIHVNTKQLRWILDCYSGSNMTMTIIILARPLGCWPFLKRKSRKMNLNPSW